jgi:hypothetical protein
MTPQEIAVIAAARELASVAVEFNNANKVFDQLLLTITEPTVPEQDFSLNVIEEIHAKIDNARTILNKAKFSQELAILNLIEAVNADLIMDDE